jgi:hypothetical protein
MACISCLAVGYAIAGQWVALAAVLIVFLGWLRARQWLSSWLPVAALVGAVGLAAAGLLVGAPPVLMILGATLALASWDLVRFDHSVTGDPSAKTIARLEKKHFESLALALGPGLLVAVAGRMIRFQIPTGVMILLVIVALLCLDRVRRMLTD